MKILILYIDTDIKLDNWFWISYTNSNAQYVDIILGTKYILRDFMFVLELSK